MVSMLSVFVHAANTLEVTYQIGNTQKVTSSGNEGELSKLLGGEENVHEMEWNGWFRSTGNYIYILNRGSSRLRMTMWSQIAP